MSCSNREERTKGKEGVFASGMHVSTLVCMYVRTYVHRYKMAGQNGGGGEWGEESKMRERREKRNHG